MPVDKSKPPKGGLRHHSQQRGKSDASLGAELLAVGVPGASGISHARELEVKRSRGEVSCAECRRLKIKCDKQIPCQSCVRRGCSALCPNGALATGQGTRFVLAATEHLHKKIARMGERIRLLEDAVTQLHARSGEHGVHPLLADTEDFTLDDGNLERESPVVTSGRRGPGVWDIDGTEGGKTPGGDVIDAFGTLSISDHGISRFFGPTGGSESLLMSNTPASSETASSPSSLSLSRSSQSLSPPSTHASAPASPLQNPSSSTFTPSHSKSHSAYANSMSPTSASTTTLFSTSAFPLTPLGPPHAVHALVTSHLPPRARARMLISCYFSQLAWLFNGVTRAQVRDMMAGIYGAYGEHEPASEDGVDVEWGADEGDAEQGGEEDEDEEDYTGPHDLALLFMIFATGALVQPLLSHPHPESDASYRNRVSAEAEHLHQIARAALSLQPVLEKPSTVTIQALHLLSIYISLAGTPNDREDGDAGTSMEMTWSLVTLAAHLSQTIGLHRDSARWGLSPKMVQRRRILFWDLFVADVWTSLNTGRPPTFSLAYIDCSLPSYKGREQDGIFQMWQFRFAADCVADVTARTLTAEAPSYATIMDLDKKVREFPLPPLDDGAPGDDSGSLARCVLEHIRETVLMYIHRSFFAQAIIEQPVNPLKSIYAPSFLAAYRSSATILKSVRDQFAVTPNACARFWTMWTFAFSAAVVFGTVVTRGPRSPLAGAAMTELEQACVLFSKAAAYSRRATKALPILTKLNEKARLALTAAQNDPSGGDKGGALWNVPMTGVLGPGGQPVKVKKEEPDDELSIFAGHTRFVSGQVQRGGTVVFPSAGVQQHHYQQQHGQQGRGRPSQHQQLSPGRMHASMDDGMQYDSYESSQRQYAPGPPYSGQQQQQPQQPAPPRQRMHSMPSSSSSSSTLHAMQNTHPHEMARPSPPTVSINVDVHWNSREYPHSAQERAGQAAPGSAVVDERRHHSAHPFYTPDGRMQPMVQQQQPPQASYTWPVETYGGEHEHPQYQIHQQQHYASPGGYAAHPEPQQQQHLAAYQAQNAELAQLGLAARDSRLDERWSTFMQDSGLLEGIEYRGR